MSICHSAVVRWIGIVTIMLLLPSYALSETECVVPTEALTPSSATGDRTRISDDYGAQESSGGLDVSADQAVNAAGTREVDNLESAQTQDVSGDWHADVEDVPVIASIFNAIGSFFQPTPRPALELQSSGKPIPPVEEPQWGLLGFFYAQGDLANLSAEDIRDCPPLLLDAYYATPIKSAKAALTVSSEGALVVQDRVTRIYSDPPQILAKPIKVSRRLLQGGKRDCLIEKDDGDVTMEFPDLDDPTFTDNPFKKPLGFRPKDADSADGHKTVVAWWDKPWKDFQIMQRYLQGLLEKREKLLKGLEIAKDTDNERQTTLFLLDLFKLDEQILGTTGVLNRVKDRLEQMGTVGDLASLGSAVAGPDGFWCSVILEPLPAGTVDHVSYVDHERVGGGRGGATVSFRELEADGVVRGWRVIFFPDGSIELTSQPLKTETDKEGISTVEPLGPRVPYDGDKVEKIKDLRNRHLDFIQQEQEKGNITEVDEERPQSDILDTRGERVDRYLDNSPEGKKKKEEDEKRQQGWDEEEKNADQLERNAKSRDANADHLEDAARDKEGQAGSQTDPDKKAALEREAEEYRRGAEEQREKADRDRREAKALYEQTAKEMRERAKKLKEDNRHGKDHRERQKKVNAEIREMENHAGELEEKAK